MVLVFEVHLGTKCRDSWISIIKDPYYFLILEWVFNNADPAISTLIPKRTSKNSDKKLGQGLSKTAVDVKTFVG